MFMDFKAAKELVARRVYEQIYTSEEAEHFFATEIWTLCGDQFSTIFVRKIVADLIAERVFEAVFFEQEGEDGFTITSKGIAFAERVINRDESDKAGLAMIPASDRVVTINHNGAEEREVIRGVEDAVEAVRQSNTILPADRGWIGSQLESGLGLLKTAKDLTLSAIRSMLLAPLGAALKSVSEEKLKEIIQQAITLLRNWLGF